MASVIDLFERSCHTDLRSKPRVLSHNLLQAAVTLLVDVRSSSSIGAFDVKKLARLSTTLIKRPSDPVAYAVGGILAQCSVLAAARLQNRAESKGNADDDSSSTKQAALVEDAKEASAAVGRLFSDLLATAVTVRQQGDYSALQYQPFSMTLAVAVAHLFGWLPFHARRLGVDALTALVNESQDGGAGSFEAVAMGIAAVIMCMARIRRTQTQTQTAADGSQGTPSGAGGALAAASTKQSQWLARPGVAVRACLEVIGEHLHILRAHAAGGPLPRVLL
jgi:hypothetical protein